MLTGGIGKPAGLWAMNVTGQVSNLVKGRYESSCLYSVPCS